MILKHIKIFRKIATGKGDDYTTGYLLDYPYFKESYKMIAIDSSKQQALGADPRTIQQINFTWNLDRAGNTTVFFIIEKAKETLKLSNWQLNILKPGIKNKIEVVLRLSSNLISNSHDKINFPQKTEGEYLGRILIPLLKIGLPSMKNVIKPLAKRVWIPLGLIAVASAADAGIRS